MLRRPLHVILNFTFIGILSLTVSGLAVAQEDRKSANYWLPHCQHAAKGNFYQGDAFMNGSCVGIISGLAFLGQFVGACRPDSATPEQAIRVVVQYLDQHPARTNEDFKTLAIEAMREAWPCNQLDKRTHKKERPRLLGGREFDGAIAQRTNIETR